MNSLVLSFLHSHIHVIPVHFLGRELRFCFKPLLTAAFLRSLFFKRQQSVSNTDKVIVQQGNMNHKQFENKEHIKTMITISSCNPVVLNHQVHSRASWRSQILEGSGRERDKHVIFVCKDIFLLTCCRL